MHPLEHVSMHPQGKYTISNLLLERVQQWAYSQANADMEEKRDKRDDSLALMQAPSWVRMRI